MSGARITVDGLWRCLCPSIDAAALATAVSLPYRPRRVGARSHAATTTCAGPRAATRRRHLHTTARKLQDDSAESKGESPAVLGRGETKANQDLSDKKTGVKIDQESTDAWKAYFDVVLRGDIEERQQDSLPASNTSIGASSRMGDAKTQEKDFPGMGFDADRAGRHDASHQIKNIEEQLSSTMADSDVGMDAFHELFGAGDEKQHSLPNILSDDGEDPFDEALDESVGKDPFNTLRDAYHEPRGKMAKFDDIGLGATPMLADTDTGAASSTYSVPLNRDSTEAQPLNGSNPKMRSQGKADEEMVERLLQMKPPFMNIPSEATKEDMIMALGGARMRAPRRYRRITATLLKQLVSMDPKPRPFYYDLLFRAHCLPEGSADVIADLLQEMRHERVHWSPNAYHSVLRALTIHPDYLIRNVIIREMKERWIDITPKGHRFIALGLLRDEQYEMALEKLEQMFQQGIEVDPWVFDIFIYVFGKLEFLDDALRLVRHRLDCGFEVSVNIWYFLLDVCSKGQNHQATTYIWNRTVQQGIVNPSDGVAMNILNMASVYGDTDLATQVIQYLAERGTRLSRPHYEALADAYSMHGNIERAIEVYCIMHNAGAEVSQASAGTLCQSLSRDPSLIDQAVEVMERLKDTYKLPVGVFNAVLNEMVKFPAPTPEKAFFKALALYRRAREFLPTGPNWETFRNLLWRCTKPDVAQFLAGEMIAFKVRQNLVISELMLKVHVEHNGPTHRVKAAFYKVAPHFHSDYALGSRRWQSIMDLSVKLVKRLIAERDPEAWRILDICRRNGLEESTIKALREEVEDGTLAKADALILPDPPRDDTLGVSQT